MRLTFMALIALSLLLGCGGGGPGVPAAKPTINGVSPTGDIGFVTDAITFNAAIDGTVTEYRWTFEGGTAAPSSGESSPTASLTTAGTFDGSLIACDGNACSDPFAFTYTVVPAEPPIVTGISPVEAHRLVGESIELRATATGLPTSFRWTLDFPPAGSPFDHSATTAQLPTMIFGVPGDHIFEVRASNRFGEGPPFTITIPVEAFDPLVQEATIDLEMLLGEEGGQPLQVVDLNGRMVVLFSSPSRPRLMISSNDSPMSVSDFTEIPRPQALPFVTDMTISDGHLVLTGADHDFDLLIAVATVNPPILTNDWSAYELATRGDNIQLLAAADGLVLMPRSNRAIGPEPLAIATSRVPLSPDDWRLGFLPEALTSGPKGFRGTVRGDQVLLYRLRNSDPSNPESPMIALESLTLPMSADPSQLSNWTVGTIVEAPENAPLAGWPHPNVGPDNALTLPVSIGTEVRRFRTETTRPTSQADWDILPSPPQRADLFERSSDPFPGRPILTGDIGWISDGSGRMAYVGLEQRLWPISQTPPLTLNLLFPGTDSELRRLGLILKLPSSQGGHSGHFTETFTPLQLSCDADHIRLVYRTEIDRQGPPPSHNAGLTFTYVTWPTVD